MEDESDAELVSVEWFQRLGAVLEEDAVYRSLSRWFAGAVLISIGSNDFTLYFHKGRLIDVDAGRALTGSDFAIVGPTEEWRKLLAGEIDLGRATTPPVGKLRIEGNVVQAAGNMRSLFHLSRVMQFVWAEA